MNCYDSKQYIKQFTLLVAEDSEFDLTRNRVYVTRKDQKFDLITVVNDKGEELEYSVEYFRFYEGERIES